MQFGHGRARGCYPTTLARITLQQQRAVPRSCVVVSVHSTVRYRVQVMSRETTQTRRCRPTEHRAAIGRHVQHRTRTSIQSSAHAATIHHPPPPPPPPTLDSCLLLNNATAAVPLDVDYRSLYAIRAHSLTLLSSEGASRHVPCHARPAQLPQSLVDTIVRAAFSPPLHVV